MKDKRQILIGIIFGVIISGIIAISMYYSINSYFFVKTEDARISGDMVRISPLSTGKLLEFFIDDGSPVEAFEIVGRTESLNLIGSKVELSLIRSPIKGTVLKKQGIVGETVSAGQTLAYVMNTDEFYISANIEETKINKLHAGQQADIRIDQIPGKVFTGKVRRIGNAANSVFSLLPTSTSSSFTKVTQKIPVIIDFEQEGISCIAGTNASIRIHIR